MGPLFKIGPFSTGNGSFLHQWFLFSLEMGPLSRKWALCSSRNGSFSLEYGSLFFPATTLAEAMATTEAMAPDIAAATTRTKDKALANMATAMAAKAQGPRSGINGRPCSMAHGPWPVWPMARVAHGPCGPWPAWPMACVARGPWNVARGLWPTLCSRLRHGHGHRVCH